MIATRPYAGGASKLFWHSIYLDSNFLDPTVKEHNQWGGGRMLVYVICGFINFFLPNSYFILQIYHVKSFKVMHVKSLYFNFQ